MRNELKRVRNWTEARLKSGVVPDRSWESHVRLVEALDAVLHDIAVAEGAPEPGRRCTRVLRLVESQRPSRDGDVAIQRRAGARR